MKTKILLLIILTGSMLFNAGCKKEEDPYTVYDNGNTVIPKVTKVISTAEFNSSLIKLDSIDYTLTLKKSTTSSNINIGDIIISSVGEGLLRKVTSVNHGQDQVKITTEEVSLSEAIQKADLDFGLSSSTKAGFFEDPKIVYMNDGVRLNDNIKGNNSINELLNNITINLKLDGDGNLQTLEDQILVSGTLSIVQSYDGKIKINNSALERLYLEYNFVEQLNLSTSYTGALVSLVKEIPFLTIVSKQPIIITAGPVPIVISPVLELFAGVNFSANSKITTSVNQSISFKAGVIYASGSWTNFGQVDKSFDFNPPTLTANASAKVYIKPKLSLKFYGSIAPSLSTPIYTQLTASATDNPWWNLKAGIKGDIGISMKILSKKILDLSTNLFDVSYPITQASGGKPLVPTLNTLTTTSIAQTSATVGGNVTSDGGAPVTERGVYWGISQNPETSGTKLLIGSGTGTFSTTLAGLIANTNYYIKAYAINSQGSGYGDQVSFKTSQNIVIPIVSTTSVTTFTSNSATVGGNVSSDGNATVTERGVYWGTSQNPETTGTKLQIGNGTGSFSNSLTGLSPNTTYYIKAFAINSQGPAYGSQQLFTTLNSSGSTTVTDIDGNVYNTVTIGTQVWMKENLKVTKFRDGTPITNVTADGTWVGLTSGAYCDYNNDVTNVAIYGRLYNFYAVVDSRNLCPSGWHVPSDTEWKTLEMYLGMSQTEADKYDTWRGTNEGGKLKETGTTHWTNPNNGATNSSGFLGLPGGQRGGYGNFGSIGIEAQWHTSTPTGGDGYRRSLYNSLSTINRYSTWKLCGYSVRCIKD